ncbi:transposase, partial [Microbacterium sp. MTN4-26]|uniref:transposase n=1 Tax=unclassified Microbacterium TaxID=2609290 RepID=UPI0036F36CA2
RTQIGTQTAATLLVCAGENLDRFGNEAAFAKLTGTAPLPASSGKTRRMRLNRGGDRQANRALHLIAVGRLRSDPRTRDYATRRAAEGLTTRDILRCLKRAIARETYNALKTDLLTT